MINFIRPNSIPKSAIGYGLIAVLVIAAAATAVTYIRFPRCYDDAYITFRYAQRLAEGFGFTYNDSIRTLGTTSPFMAIALSFGAIIFSTDSIPALARLIGAISFIFSTYLIYSIVDKLTGKKWMAIVSAFLYATYHPSVQSSATGMEVPLFIALILAAFRLALSGKSFLPGLLVGILIGIRPDGIVWAAALGLFYWNDPRRLWRYGVGFLIPAVPTVIALTLYFGSPLPLSIVAKQVSYGPFLNLDLNNMLKVLGVAFPDRISNNPLNVIVLWSVILVISALAIIRALKTNNNGIVPVVGFIILYPLFLWYGRTIMFIWYGYVLFPMFLILIADFASERLASLMKSPIAVGIVILVLLVWSGIFVWRVFIFEPAYGHGGPGLVDTEQRGLYFRDHAPPDASIFTEAIPQVGYISGRKIYCEIGLVSPEIVEIKRRYGYKIKENSEWYFDVLKEYRPDYLMIHAVQFDRNCLMPYEDAPLLADKADSLYFYGHYELIPVSEIIASGDYTGIIPERYYIFKRK
jgi:hypothetical protein